MKKRNNICILIFLLIILLSSSTIAFSGVSPAKIKKNFIPNKKENLEFKIYGYDDPSVKTNCPEILSVNNIVPQEDHHVVSLILTLPEEMKDPGENRCNVKFYEESSNKNFKHGLGTKTAVGGLVIINVPYPGLYAKLELTAQNVNRDELEVFHVHVKNLGEETLKDIKVNIKIYDVEDKLVGMISTDKVTIERFLFRETDVVWDTKGIEPGRHKAVATLMYDGDRQIEDEAEFLIGKIFIEIKDASVNGTPFQINPFEIDVESWWGNKISNVYAEVSMKNASGVDAGPFRTVSIDLEPWQKKKLGGHWDASLWGPGNYTAEIKINYEDKITNATWSYELRSLPEKRPDFKLFLDSAKNIILNPIFLITIIVLIVIILIIDILWMRKNKKRK